MGIIPREIATTTDPTTRRPVALATAATRSGIDAADIAPYVDAVAMALAGPQGLDRPYWRGDYTVTQPGSDQLVLRPGLWPIESVASVTIESSGTVIASSEYTVRETSIYRRAGWPRSVVRHEVTWDPTFTGYGGDLRHYVAALTAGWLMPDQVSTWAASTAYAAGAWVRSTDITIRDRFELTTAGTSDATEPDWSSIAVGETIPDSSAVWTRRAAREIPADLSEAAMLWVLDAYAQRTPTEALRSVAEAGHSRSYDVGQRRPGPPVKAAAIITGYR